MQEKIIVITMSLFLMTTTVLLAEAKILIPSEEQLKASNEYLGANLSIYPPSYDFGNMIIGEINFTTFEIWNDGCCYLSYSLTEDCSWVNITPTTGFSSGEHHIITVSIDTNFLTIGYHQCDIHIDSNVVEKVFHVSVNCSIADAPKITLYPGKYDFGVAIKGTNVSTSFEIWNCGIDSLSYSVSEPPNWIDVYPMSGTSTGEHDTITVNITTSDLSSGSYTAALQINSTGGQRVFLFDINIKNPIPELSYSPQTYNSGYKLRGETYLTTFEIWNSGIQTLRYSLIENCSWITVYPTSGESSGEHDTITVYIDAISLEQRSNRCDIYIDTNGGVGYFRVTVMIGVGYTNITVEQAWNLLTNTSNGIQIPIDVRYDNEWAVAHIDTPTPENPRHHCLCAWSDETVLQGVMDLYQGKEIIVYCKAGSRSLTAVNMLVAHNFDGTIYNMIGGIDAWTKVGYPTKPNTPPNIPVITGDKKGKVGEEYYYTFTTTDADSDDVYYYVNWSDNTTNQLVGLYHSGDQATLNHTWSEKGTCTIKVKARDVYGSESDYAILEIKMPKTSNSIFHQLQLKIFEKIHFFLYL